MVNRDYTKEVGLSSGPKKLPRAVSGVIIVIVAVALVAFIVGIAKEAKPHAHASTPPAASGASGQ